VPHGDPRGSDRRLPEIPPATHSSQHDDTAPRLGVQAIIFTV
jgi:hypothetical protein